MKKLVIRNTQAPGDIIVLSAAIRDLHRCHPGEYETSVSVSKGAEQVYWHNPDVKQCLPMANYKVAEAQTFVAKYPLIHKSNQQQVHFLWGFIRYMNEQLHTKIKLTDFRPAIYLSDEEKAERPFPDPYWVFLSGGKTDFVTKIWDQRYWQEVIDALRGRVNFVQLGGGSKNHIYHEPKQNTYANLVAKTSCRDFLKLIYHSDGVVCGVTMAMHAAAAFNKPCVVIAGGREHWWWEAYNKENRIANMRLGDSKWQCPDDDYVYHTYLHTIGQLDCCRTGGCWKKAVKGKSSACRHPTNQHGMTIPKCLAICKPEHVIEAIDNYLKLGASREATTPVIASPMSQEPLPVTCCIAGDVDVPAELANATVLRGTDRVELLRRAQAADNDLVVWLEDTVQLPYDWFARLRKRVAKPRVLARVHRTSDGQLYPYPAFFVAHKQLLSPNGTYERSFAATADQYSPIDDIVRLPTTVKTTS